MGKKACVGERKEERENKQTSMLAFSRILAGGLMVRGALWRRLFPHQRTCLEWLWELHRQEVRFDKRKKKKEEEKRKKRASSGCGSAPQAGGERDVNSEHILSLKTL